MKKTRCFLFTLVLLLLAGCSPKINHGTMQDRTDKPSVSQAVYQTVTLYFPDSDAMYLIKESREAEVKQNQSIELLTLQELLKGPKGDDLYPAIKGDVKILSVSTQNGLCTVDFSAAFADSNTGGSTQETFAVQSVVHSLCSIDGIDRVKINIEGNVNPSFGGHFLLDEPFSPDTELLKS